MAGPNSCCCGKYNARDGSKIIGVTSAMLTAITIIGCIWEVVRAEQAEQARNKSMEIYIYESVQRGINDLIGDHSNQQLSPVARKRLFGMAIGIGLFSCLVAVALIFATKKNNRLLALPFMIWTIIAQVACGILIPVIAIFCIMVDWSAPDSGEYIHVFVIPLVAFVISFVLNTWWLVVVFNFYKLLKSGQTFDDMQMQTA